MKRPLSISIILLSTSFVSVDAVRYSRTARFSLADSVATSIHPKRRKSHVKKQQHVRSVARRLHDIAEENCEEDAERNESFLVDVALDCRCRRRTEDVLLMCADGCAYCNDAMTACGVQSAQASYDIDDGMRTAIGGVFEYVSGFDDTLAVENLDCVEEDGRIVACERCNVYVNGKRCNSCELRECDAGGQAEYMDCENIESGAIFNFCEEVAISADSVFNALSTSEFEECLALEHLSLGKGVTSKSTKKASTKAGSSTKGKSGKGVDTESKSAKKAKARGRRQLSNDAFFSELY